MEALKEDKTLSQIASQYGVHHIQVSKWKKELLDGAEGIFEDKRSRRKEEGVARRQAIEPRIGHMKSDGKLNRNYLKRKLGDQLNAVVGLGKIAGSF